MSDEQRLSMNLTTRGAADLHLLTTDGQTKTEAVHRALRLAAHVERAKSAGHALFLRGPDGRLREVVIL